MLKDKNILIGITGSIAAYKIITLVRLLKKEQANVKIIMTKNATNFVSPLVLSVLSENDCLIEINDKNNWNNHIKISNWANLFVIAPLSCNTLAKMANGFCDNLLLAIYLSANCKIIVAPAMDENMWHHKITQNNILKIKDIGIKVLEVENGFLASGIIGDGRMQEPENLLLAIKNNI